MGRGEGSGRVELSCNNEANITRVVRKHWVELIERFLSKNRNLNKLEQKQKQEDRKWS